MLTNLISVNFMTFISQNHVSEVENKNKRTIHFLDKMAIYSSKIMFNLKKKHKLFINS